MNGTIISLNCARCGTGLERAERKVGICVHCENRELEAEVDAHDHEVDQELEQLQQELWQA